MSDKRLIARPFSSIFVSLKIFLVLAGVALGTRREHGDGAESAETLICYTDSQRYLKESLRRLWALCEYNVRCKPEQGLFSLPEHENNIHHQPGSLLPKSVPYIPLRI